MGPFRVDRYASNRFLSTVRCTHIRTNKTATKPSQYNKGNLSILVYSWFVHIPNAFSDKKKPKIFHCVSRLVVCKPSNGHSILKVKTQWTKVNFSKYASNAILQRRFTQWLFEFWCMAMAGCIVRAFFFKNKTKKTKNILYTNTDLSGFHRTNALGILINVHLCVHAAIRRRREKQKK